MECLKKQLELSEAHKELLRDHIQLRRDYERLDAEFRSMCDIVNRILTIVEREIE